MTLHGVGWGVGEGGRIEQKGSFFGFKLWILDLDFFNFFFGSFHFILDFLICCMPFLKRKSFFSLFIVVVHFFSILSISVERRKHPVLFMFVWIFRLVVFRLSS